MYDCSIQNINYGKLFVNLILIYKQILADWIVLKTEPIFMLKILRCVSNMGKRVTKTEISVLLILVFFIPDV